MIRTRNASSRIRIWLQTSLGILALFVSSTQANTSALSKGSYSYIGGKSKDISNQGAFISPSSSVPSPHHQPVPNNALSGSATTTSLAATSSYYEPRGDYGGGAGGGWGGGSGGHSVYQYSLQPQPYYHPAPMYYDDGGYEGMEKGLLGLLGLGGLGGLKGLVGLLGLAKLLLPLLGLLLPLLLPLLLLKALALLALILLIPVPVITTGTAGRNFRIPTSFDEGKEYLKETLTELLTKIPSDMNRIIGKIKDASQSTEVAKFKEVKSSKPSSDKPRLTKTNENMQQRQN